MKDKLYQVVILDRYYFTKNQIRAIVRVYEDMFEYNIVNDVDFVSFTKIKELNLLEILYSIEPASGFIPLGSYLVDWYDSPRFGKKMLKVFCSSKKTFLIHSGNSEKDTDGCILLGTKFSKMDKEGNCKLLNSRIAMSKFIDSVNIPFLLKIIS